MCTGYKIEANLANYSLGTTNVNGAFPRMLENFKFKKILEIPETFWSKRCFNQSFLQTVQISNNLLHNVGGLAFSKKTFLLQNRILAGFKGTVASSWSDDQKGTIHLVFNLVGPKIAGLSPELVWNLSLSPFRMDYFRSFGHHFKWIIRLSQ